MRLGVHRRLTSLDWVPTPGLLGLWTHRIQAKPPCDWLFANPWAEGHVGEISWGRKPTRHNIPRANSIPANPRHAQPRRRQGQSSILCSIQYLGSTGWTRQSREAFQRGSGTNSRPDYSRTFKNISVNGSEPSSIQSCLPEPVSQASTRLKAEESSGPDQGRSSGPVYPGCAAVPQTAQWPNLGTELWVWL